MITYEACYNPDISRLFFTCAMLLCRSSSITITGDSGAALIGNAFKVSGGVTGLTFNGTTGPNTETIQGTLVVANGGTGATTLTGVLIGNGVASITGNALVQDNVLIGGASNAIVSVAPSAIAGVPFVSTGSHGAPNFGTATVEGGGTGVTTLTPYALLAGGTTTTGQVLTSNGAGVLPSFQSVSATGAITAIDGNTGTAVTPTAGLIAEEVEHLYPELIRYDEDGNAQSVRYHLLYALLIKMIQENRKLLQAHEEEIADLKGQIVSLKVL